MDVKKLGKIPDAAGGSPRPSDRQTTRTEEGQDRLRLRPLPRRRPHPAGLLRLLPDEGHHLRRRSSARRDLLPRTASPNRHAHDRQRLAYQPPSANLAALASTRSSSNSTAPAERQVDVNRTLQTEWAYRHTLHTTTTHSRTCTLSRYNTHAHTHSEATTHQPLLPTYARTPSGDLPVHPLPSHRPHHGRAARVARPLPAPAPPDRLRRPRRQRRWAMAALRGVVAGRAVHAAAGVGRRGAEVEPVDRRLGPAHPRHRPEHSCWWSCDVPPLIAPPTRLASRSSSCAGPGPGGPGSSTRSRGQPLEPALHAVGEALAVGVVPDAPDARSSPPASLDALLGDVGVGPQRLGAGRRPRGVGRRHLAHQQERVAPARAGPRPARACR